ncbi:hypothetical protein Y032_1041g3472 [Ancylostoma ceylanicum]|uniref:Uncharacterized protein n=1 Tax=Ancylostoma ceylanicum TaxID=53326 RepID=A0A016W6N5_9BILA|nr:hypothetical protein Y032_1041g3472 [Ancylostoma ceylanicum]
MLNSPIRIFRCPICIEHDIKAPLQDLSILIEHLAKHFQFYLFECRHCNDRFATPFLANFHIKEGRCKQNGGDSPIDEKQPLSSVNLNKVDFTSFCYLQNAITKSIKEMLVEQTKRIQYLLGKERERVKKEAREKRRPVTPPRFGESPASPERGPPNKRPRPPENSTGYDETKELETWGCTIPECCSGYRYSVPDEIFGLEPPRRDIRVSLLRKPRVFRTFQDSANYRKDSRTFQESSYSCSENKSTWPRDEKQTATGKLPPLSEAFASWRCSKDSPSY